MVASTASKKARLTEIESMLDAPEAPFMATVTTMAKPDLEKNKALDAAMAQI